MLTAAEILSDTGLDHPDVKGRLSPVSPGSVPVKKFPFWIDLVLPSWIGAITTPSTIWVRARMLAIGGESLGRLIIHELVHTRQWREHGILGFLGHYVKDYFAARFRDRNGHRAAYRAISFESEAGAVAAAASGTVASGIPSRSL